MAAQVNWPAEAWRYEEQYGPAEPYRTATEYHHGRLALGPADRPDELVWHYARVFRTPPCVLRGACTLNNHQEECPYGNH